MDIFSPKAFPLFFIFLNGEQKVVSNIKHWLLESIRQLCGFFFLLRLVLLEHSCTGFILSMEVDTLRDVIFAMLEALF